MATLYNKTALNKIKKAELVQLFLDQQAEKNQLILDAEEHEKLKSHIIYMGHTKMKADLKKLKEVNKKLKDQLNFMFPSKDAENIIAKYQVDRTNRLIEIKKLQTQIDNLKGDVKFWSDKAEVIQRDHDRLDENYKLHKKSADIYEEKLIEEIQILRKKPNIENENLKEENEELKQENENLRETIKRTEEETGRYNDLLNDWMMTEVYDEFINHVFYADYLDQVDGRVHPSTRQFINKFFKMDDEFITEFDNTKEEKNKHLNRIWKGVKESLIENGDYRPDKVQIQDNYEWIK